MKKFLVASLSALLLINLNNGTAIGQNIQDLSSQSLIKANIQSQRIPIGTKIKLRMENPINSQNSGLGDSFICTIMEDIIVNDELILPAGSIIRGKVENIKKNALFCIGAQMTISLEHIVTPVGKQVPLKARLTGINGLTNEGVIHAGGGYFNQLEKNMDHSSQVFHTITGAGVEYGKSIGNGFPVVVTAPAAAVGGIFIGGGTFVTKSVMALFKKGPNVKIHPGDTFELITTENLDIPTH